MSILQSIFKRFTPVIKLYRWEQEDGHGPYWGNRPCGHVMNALEDEGAWSAATHPPIRMDWPMALSRERMGEHFCACPGFLAYRYWWRREHARLAPLDNMILVCYYVPHDLVVMGRSGKQAFFIPSTAVRKRIMYGINNG